MLVFGWLAVAGRAASDRPPVPPCGSPLGGDATGAHEGDKTFGLTQRYDEAGKQTRSSDSGVQRWLVRI